MKQVFKEELQLHVMVKRRALELDEHIHVTVGAGLTVNRGPKQANPADGEALHQRRPVLV
jgi:hypothetical protein